MADEQEQTVEPTVADSVPETTEAVADTTPAEESSAPETPQAIPYDRFKEVNDEKNEWKERYLSAQRDSAPKVADTTAPDVSAQQVQAMMADGFDEPTAKRIVATSKALVSAEVDTLRKETAIRESDYQMTQFRKDNSDFDEHKADMAKVYGGVGDAAKFALANDPNSMDYLIQIVRGQKASAKTTEATAQGANVAYETKGLKAALGSQSGKAAVGSAKPKITRAWLDQADPTSKEYQDRSAEIDKAMRDGTIE